MHSRSSRSSEFRLPALAGRGAAPGAVGALVAVVAALLATAAMGLDRPAGLPALAAAILVVPPLLDGRGAARRRTTRPLWRWAVGLFLGAAVVCHFLRLLPPGDILAITCLFLTLHRAHHPNPPRHLVELWGLSVLLMMVVGLEGSGLLPQLLTVLWGVGSCLLLAGMARPMMGGGAPRHHPALLVVGCLLVSGLVFVALPRWRPSVPPASAVPAQANPAQRALVRAGFSESVDFSTLSLIRDSPGVAFRVPDPPMDADLDRRRWRMATLDRFDGMVWHRDDGGRPSTFTLLMAPDRSLPGLEAAAASGDAAALHWWQIRLVDLPSQILPVPEGTLSLDGLADDVVVRLEENGQMSLPRPRPGFRYEVWAQRRVGPSGVFPLLRGKANDVHREVPAELAASLDRIVNQLFPGGPPADALEAASIVRNHFRQTGVYTLDLRLLGEGGSAIAAFLAGSPPRGHCELFATAAALVLRRAGVPTRLVTGFSGGELVRRGAAESRELVVGHRHAHAWVEAHVGAGWVSIDPTPDAPAQPGVAAPLRVAGEMISSKGRRLAGLVEGWDHEAQRRWAEGALAAARRHVGAWEGGALVRAGGRVAQNIAEPPVLALAVVLLVLNGLAWWAMVAWRRRRVAVVPRSVPPILARLVGRRAWQAAGWPAATPAELLARARPGDAEAARLYNWWRYGDGGREAEQALRRLIASGRP